MGSKYEKRLNVDQWKKLPLMPLDIPVHSGVYAYKNEIYDHLNTCLNPRQKRIFNYLICWTNEFPEVYPSVGTLARRLEVSYWAVWSTIDKLRRLGYISTYYRVQDSSLYRIAPLFYDPVIRWKLKDLFPALKVVHTVLLTCLCLFNHLLSVKTKETLTAKYTRAEKSTLESSIRDQYRDVFGSFEENIQKIGEPCMETNAISLPVGYYPDLSVRAQSFKWVEFNVSALCLLSAFPEPVLHYVDDVVSKKKDSIDKVFSFVQAVAKNYANKIHQPVDYQKALQLSTQYQVKDEVPIGTILKEPRSIPPSLYNKPQPKPYSNYYQKHENRLKEKYPEFTRERSRQQEYEQIEKYKATNAEFASSLQRLRVKPDWNPFADTENEGDSITNGGASLSSPVLGLFAGAHEDPFIKKAPVKYAYDFEPEPMYDDNVWEEVTDPLIEGVV